MKRIDNKIEDKRILQSKCKHKWISNGVIGVTNQYTNINITTHNQFRCTVCDSIKNEQIYFGII